MKMSQKKCTLYTKSWRNCWWCTLSSKERVHRFPKRSGKISWNIRNISRYFVHNSRQCPKRNVHCKQYLGAENPNVNFDGKNLFINWSARKASRQFSSYSTMKYFKFLISMLYEKKFDYERFPEISQNISWNLRTHFLKSQETFPDISWNLTGPP
jgi:hypothetical protein